MNVELQQKTVSTINKILTNDYVEEEQPVHHNMHTGAHGQQHHAMGQQPMVRGMTGGDMQNYGHYNYGYPQMQYQQNHNHHQQQPYFDSYDKYPKFSLDLKKFYIELSEKREIVKEPRIKIIDFVQKVVEEIDIIDHSEIYGSYKTELDLPTSDIDFVICSQKSNGRDCLSDLNDKLTETKYEWIDNIQYISSASIPIIKIDTKVGEHAVKVDITYKDEGHKGND
jgi:DNA polymerase sigma